MKRPSFQFYPNDWLNDPKLRMADWEVKGLWIDLLCYMHNEYHYGYLRVGEKYLDENGIKQLLNANTKRFHRVFNALITLDIIGDDDLGFFSKRMVEDERIRQIRAEAGVKGGNPNLVNQKFKQNPTPSSSSSSSSSSSININNTQPAAEEKISPRCLGKSPRQKAMLPEDAEKDAEFERWYSAYPRREAKGAARKAYWAARKKVSAEVLLEGISRYRANKPHYADWRMPATWLNSESWTDDYSSTPVSASAKTPRKPAHLAAWEAGRRFFHEGWSKTFQASELEPINFIHRIARADQPIDGFKLPDGLPARFEEFVIEEETP